MRIRILTCDFEFLNCFTQPSTQLLPAFSEVAMTLEFVTYNGNMDMFSHARVKFELQPTGFLDSIRSPGCPKTPSCCSGCCSGKSMWWCFLCRAVDSWSPMGPLWCYFVGLRIDALTCQAAFFFREPQVLSGIARGRDQLRQKTTQK